MQRGNHRPNKLTNSICMVLIHWPNMSDLYSGINYKYYQRELELSFKLNQIQSANIKKKENLSFDYMKAEQRNQELLQYIELVSGKLRSRALFCPAEGCILKVKVNK